MQTAVSHPPTDLASTAIAVTGAAENAHLSLKTGIAKLDASKLKITLNDSPGVVVDPETLVFGVNTTDHMLIMSFDPVNGWSAPEIKPFGPLLLDPRASCFQYSPNAFEGMKAYMGPDGEPRLFRPERNMARLRRSAERVALPPFDENELLKLIKKLVQIDKRFIPTLEGYSMYIRPTIIGTRPALGVAASDHALLYAVLSPTGPYFKTATPKAVSLLAVSEHVRSWPGGTGGYKLAINYAPGFMPQRVAAKLGYDQVLWLLESDGGLKVTEAGAMNFFAVLQREDGDLDIVTPPLDGTILPGILRASSIELLAAHGTSSGNLPNLPSSLKLHVYERPIYVSDLIEWSESKILKEVFCSGTAVIIAPVGRIGLETSALGQDSEGARKDLVLEDHEGALGPVARALWQRIVEIQEGRFEWEGWSVPC